MRSIALLEKEAIALGEKLAATAPSTATRANKSSSPAVKATIDWREAAARITRAESSSTAETRESIDFQKRLMEMSKEEMIASLDELEGLDLSDDEREAMEELILEPLIREDPEYALTRFADRIESDSNGIGWQLSEALRNWAKTDLTAATAWFDREIANGKFESKTLDGKSEMRVQFESALMGSLLASDPNAAGQRLAAMPEDDRREILEQIPFSELAPADRKAYTDLVRQLVPADERAGSFAHIASQLVDGGGYSQVSVFLDAVSATAEERAASAVQTAESRLESLGLKGGITREEIDSLREWLARQAPGKVDAITGKALAEASQDRGKFKFAEASELVLDYQKSSGSDDVLVSFLESYSARSNLEEARHLADMITDEARRARILQQLK